MIYPLRLFNYSIYLFLCLCTLGLSDDITFSGFGSTGYIIYNRSIVKGFANESFYEGKLQADIKINKDIEGQLDFRGHSADRVVELREFSVKLKHYTYFKFKIGNIKLPFGYEQLTNRELLPTIERSNLHEQISNLGYGGRSFGLMTYYKYSEKRADFPFSYYMNIYRDNSLRGGLVARGAWHTGNLIFALNYQYQRLGGNNTLSSNGLASDIVLVTEKAEFMAAMVYFLDPNVSLQHRLQNNEGTNPEKQEEYIYGSGLKFRASWRFDVDTKMIHMIEPLYLFSVYFPDMDNSDGHELQHLIGVNFYFSKKARFRLQGDLRYDKTPFSDAYNIQASRFTVDVQIRF